MEPANGNGRGRTDPGWKSSFLANPLNKNDVTCNFCKRVVCGGIFRMKLHLTTGHRNVTVCNKVPDHVKIELTEYMAGKKSAREQLHMVHQFVDASNLDEYGDGDADILQVDPKGKRKAADNSTQARQVGPLDSFEWSFYGASTPSLQQFAIKILSLTCSASGCERNWSTFEHIHSKKRNRLDQSRLNYLVYVKYNRALIQRYQLRDSVDPIRLKDLDTASEWLTRKDPEDVDNELVFEDDGLTWGQVADAVGVHEDRFNFRSRSVRNGDQGSSSQAQPSRNQVEDEEEDDNEGYESLNEDGMDGDAYLVDEEEPYSD